MHSNHQSNIASRKILTLIAVSLTFWQCKAPQQNKSPIKTLDNVANSTSEPVNHPCGIAFDGNGDLPLAAASLGTSLNIVSLGDASLKNAVIGALEAVPRPLLQLFFTVFKGQIVIGDATNLCKATPFTNSQKPLVSVGKNATSCWLSPANGQGLRMLLSPEVILIRSSLLRLFAYWQMEFVIEGLLKPGIPAPFKAPDWQTYAQDFIAERGRLASAFLTDMSAQLTANGSKLKEYNAQDPNGFGNLIYANAVDSYYCSKQTRDDFQRSFKKAWSVFTDRRNGLAVAKELGAPGASF